MNEIRLEERGDDTPPAPPTTFPADPQEPDEGSIGLGVALAWGVVIVGNMITIFLTAFLQFRNVVTSSIALILNLVPQLAAIVLAVSMYRRGKRRTGLGIVLGLVSMVAVTLLLVAACFGLIFMGH